MSLWDSLFGGGKNPADAAMPYINQIPGQAHQTYDPYVQQGQAAYNVLSPQFQGMTEDPTGYLDSLMQGYEPSRAYQLKRDEAMRAAGNTAAAGGMRGSMQDITRESRLADSLLGDDMQQWLNNVMGIQGRGMQGEQGFYQTGFAGAQGLENELANALAQQANLAFQGQAEQNKRGADMWSGIGQGIGAIGSLAGNFF